MNNGTYLFLLDLCFLPSNISPLLPSAESADAAGLERFFLFLELSEVGRGDSSSLTPRDDRFLSFFLDRLSESSSLSDLASEL